EEVLSGAGLLRLRLDAVREPAAIRRKVGPADPLRGREGPQLSRADVQETQVSPPEVEVDLIGHRRSSRDIRIELEDLRRHGAGSGLLLFFPGAPALDRCGVSLTTEVAREE